jgi:eukaryotic-like serine/threonine-protein kinase
MSEAWKKWEGQVVDGRFPLRQLLGESDHSAVFGTERMDRGGAKAAIKVVALSGSAAEEQLERWRGVARLSHANVLPLYHSGRCRLGEMDFVFAVMEFADETLAEILPQRALSTEEARQMLVPVLDALVFLHQQGLAHGDIQPANILAVGETIKLSSDTIRPVAIGTTGKSSAGGSAEPASDVYSLGTTIVQALTQRSPGDPGASLSDTAGPLPAPFDEFLRHCLDPDPQLRWTAAEIAAGLNPATAAAAAASARARQQKKLPEVATAKSDAKHERTATERAAAPSLARTPAAVSSPAAVPLSPVAPPAKQVRTAAQSPSLLRWAVPIAVAAILLLMASRVFHRSSLPSTTDATAAKPASGPEVVEAKAPMVSTPAPRSNKVVPLPAESRSADYGAAQPPALKAQIGPKKPAEPASQKASEPEPAPAALRSEVRSASAGTSRRADVVQQVLPDVSEKALSTIHGAVRLTIRAQVDAAGKVADAQVESPSGSSFFNELALKAARRWQFAPRDATSVDATRVYLLHFEFTQGGAKASATPGH